MSTWLTSEASVCGLNLPVGRLINAGLFSSATFDWATPEAVYAELNEEFHFTHDPAPLAYNGLWSGLAESWEGTIFCNPPYGRIIGQWIQHGYESSLKGATVVMLIPSRTDTAWWHDYVMKASEIRFIRGRLKFGGATINAPFPSAVIVFKSSP